MASEYHTKSPVLRCFGVQNVLNDQILDQKCFKKIVSGLIFEWHPKWNHRFGKSRGNGWLRVEFLLHVLQTVFRIQHICPK